MSRLIAGSLWVTLLFVFAGFWFLVTMFRVIAKGVE